MILIWQNIFVSRCSINATWMGSGEGLLAERSMTTGQRTKPVRLLLGDATQLLPAIRQNGDRGLNRTHPRRAGRKALIAGGFILALSLWVNPGTAIAPHPPIAVPHTPAVQIGQSLTWSLAYSRVGSKESMELVREEAASPDGCSMEQASLHRGVPPDTQTALGKGLQSRIP